MRILTKNRKAFHNYFVEDTFETGIVLLGPEVKSCYQGNVDLSDGYVVINDNSVVLKNIHIDRYNNSGQVDTGYLEKRDRLLLLKKQEISKLNKKIAERGYTLIPLSMYIHPKTKKIKIELGLCKGKKLYDKRDTLKKKQIQKDIQRELKYK